MEDNVRGEGPGLKPETGSARLEEAFFTTT